MPPTSRACSGGFRRPAASAATERRRPTSQRRRWIGRARDTFIQKEGIADDFGVFDSPDAFYARHGSNLSGLRRWLYERVIRHAMNRNVERIRAGNW